MATKKRVFYNGEFYHIILKGVDGKSIFLDNQDRYRMIHDMFVFNDKNCCLSTLRNRKNIMNKIEKYQRHNLVSIHAFCLMGNHMHFLLEQKTENGISRFMLKLGAGYASYFNSKYHRTGHLFQGRFKSAWINDGDRLAILFAYIHTNPVSIICPNWKEDGIKDLDKAIKFIEKYKWSSYADYIGGKNFPSLTQRSFMLEDQEQKRWKKFVDDWLEYKADTFEKHFWNVNKNDYLLE